MSVGSKPEISIRKKHISELYLVLTTALWGTTFIVTKETAQIVPPFFYMMIRFLLAGIIFFPFIKHFKGFTFKHLKVSFVAGIIYFLSNAILWAIYVIYIDKHLNHMDIISFSAVHIIFVGLYNGVVSLIFEDWSGYIFPNFGEMFSIQVWVIIFYVALIATSGSLIFQFAGQKNLSPSRSAVIFALEPVFATFFAVWWGGELINLQIIIGAMLIFTSILISIERKKERKKLNSSILRIGLVFTSISAKMRKIFH